MACPFAVATTVTCEPDPSELFGVTHYLVSVEGAPGAVVQPYLSGATAGTTSTVLDDEGAGIVDLRPNAVQILFDAPVTFRYTLGALEGPLTEPVRLSDLPNRTGSGCGILVLGAQAPAPAEGSAPALPEEIAAETGPSEAEEPVAPATEPVAPADAAVSEENPAGDSEADDLAPTAPPSETSDEQPTEPSGETTPPDGTAPPSDTAPPGDTPPPSDTAPPGDTPPPSDTAPPGEPAPTPETAQVDAPVEPPPPPKADPPDIPATQEQGLLGAAIGTVGDVLDGAITPDEAASPAE